VIHMVIAFFDLDHTLLDGANGNIAVRYMVKKGLLPWTAVLRALKYSVLYRMNRIPYMEVYRWTFEECGRYHIDDLVRMLDDGYAQGVLPRLYVEGRDRIAWHRDAGHLTVIATAAGEYMSEKVRVQLGAEDKIAATAPVRDGYLTTEFDEPLPYGEGKLERAREYARLRGTGLEDCWFYSDSVADLPLLEAVGHPVAVNPQRKLRKLAAKRGWTVLDWRVHLTGEVPSVPRELSFPVATLQREG
jgi:HAD superfamily hydrolase (TIGR01490 family)